MPHPKTRPSNSPLTPMTPPALLKTGTHWYNKSFAGYLFGIYDQGIAIAQAMHDPQYAQYMLKLGLFFINHQHTPHFDWFWDIDEQLKHRKNLLTKIQADHSFIDTFVKYWEKKRTAFVKYHESLNLDDLYTLEDKKLASVVEKYTLLLADTGIGYIVDNFLSDEGDWLIDAIKKELGPNVSHEVIETLTLPSFTSFVNESELSLMLVAQLIAIKKSQKIILSAATKHAEEYYWVKATYLDYPVLTPQKVIGEAEELLHTFAQKKVNLAEKIDEEKNRITHNKKAKAALLKKLTISANLRAVIHAAELFTYVQDRRKEGVLRTNTIFLNLLAYHAQKANIPLTSMMSITPNEFVTYLRDGHGALDWNAIGKRYAQGCLALFAEGRDSIIPATDYPTYVVLSNFFKDHGKVTEIKGSVAYKGVVRGKVQVLKNSRHIGLFVQGNILVANQTTPEFVPAMKKASAIITDQGGITCHAAIVARELKVPCVIGTKIATKVLKDGDLVEVDAEKGIIRVVS